MTTFSIRFTVPFFIFAAFSSCAPKTKLIRYETANYSVSDSLHDNETASKTIAPYKQGLNIEMNTVLNSSELAMEMSKPEGLLGNFVADLVLKKSREYYLPSDNKMLDFCLLNYRGLRASLPKGNIIKRNVFELMPFENELVVLTITSQKTLELFQYVCREGGVPVAGVKVRIENMLPELILINGEPFDSARTYKIVTTDYLANGGDNMKFLTEPLRRENLNRKIRDVIMEYMVEEREKGRKLNAIYDGRIYYAK